MRVWDIESKKCVASHGVGGTWPYSSVAFHPRHPGLVAHHREFDRQIGFTAADMEAPARRPRPVTRADPLQRMSNVEEDRWIRERLLAAGPGSSTTVTAIEDSPGRDPEMDAALAILGLKSERELQRLAAELSHLFQSLWESCRSDERRIHLLSIAAASQAAHELAAAIVVDILKDVDAHKLAPEKTAALGFAGTVMKRCRKHGTRRGFAS